MKIPDAAQRLFNHPLRPERPHGDRMVSASYSLPEASPLAIPSFTLPDGTEVPPTTLPVSAVAFWHGTNHWRPRLTTEIDLHGPDMQSLVRVGIVASVSHETADPELVVLLSHTIKKQNYLTQYPRMRAAISLERQPEGGAVPEARAQVGSHVGAVLLGACEFIDCHHTQGSWRRTD